MSDAVSDGSPARRSIKEVLGSKVNPFTEPTTDAVSRSADFRRISMLPRRTTWHDLGEALAEVRRSVRAVAPGGCACARNRRGRSLSFYKSAAGSRSCLRARANHC